MKKAVYFIKKNFIELSIVNAITIAIIGFSIMMLAMADPEAYHRMSERSAGDWIRFSALMTVPVFMMNIFYWMKRESF